MPLFFYAMDSAVRSCFHRVRTVLGLLSPSTRVVTLLMGIFLLSFSCMGAQGVFTHEVPSTVLAEKAVVWGNPLADGPIRALVIAPRFTLGDVAQLAVRLEMQCETVALWSADSIGFDPMAVASLPDGGRREDILERIREGLDERLDVIVLANFDTDILPEAVFSKILDKVAGGTGLLLAHLQNGVDSPLHIVLDVLSPVDHGYPIWQGVGTCLFPGYTSLEGLSHVFSHGDGRVVVLEYLGDPPHNHCLIQPPADPLDMDPLYEDNAYSFVARAVGVAARRFDEIRIDALYDRAPQGPQDDEIPPDFYPEFVQAMRDSVVAQPARPFQMTFNKPTDRRYTVRAQLRRVASNVVISWHDSESLPKGTTAHQFEIPVGSGAYTMDVWLHDRSGIVDWYSKDFNLSGWPEFQELKLEKTWLLPNDSLDFSLEVRPVANHRRTATIYARAVDEYDRVVSEAYAEVDHQGGTLNLRLHFSDLLSTLLKVEVFAVEGRKRILSEWELHASYREVRYLSVRQHAVRGSMDVVALGEDAREYIPLHYLKCLSDMGITWAHVPAGEAAIVNIAKQRLRLLPQVDGKAVMTLRDTKYREPCLNDPIFRNENKDALRDTTLRHWAGGFGYYSLGDSNSLSTFSPQVCQCRYCQEYFQQMLSHEYGTVAALNDTWQESFGDWDFVEMPTAFGPGEGGSVAPWIDFRRCMDRTFSEYNGWARQIVQHTDPGATVGARFTSDLGVRGYYWPLLFDALDFVVCDYSPLMVMKTRSYSKSDAWTGTVLTHKDSAVSPESCAWLPWRLALDGIQAIWLDGLYGDAVNPLPDAWLLPDGTATESLRVLTETVAKINKTVGPLLYAADPAAPAIAIYDSHSSRHLASVDPLYRRSSAESQQAAADLIRLAGYPFDFIDKARLLEISVEKYKVILLPGCRTLGDDEVAVLMRYVAEGGSLIADIVPGDCDLHGHWCAEYRLGSVYGIDISSMPEVVSGSLAVTSSDSSDTVDAGVVRINRSVVLELGTAPGAVEGAPAWVLNRQEAGHTLLLNHPFRSVVYEKGRRLVPHEFHTIKAFLEDIPGVPPRMEPESFLGTIHTYRFGEARLLVVLPDPDVPRQSLRLPIQRDEAAYDVFTGEKIRSHRKKFRLIGGQPLVIAVLPRAIKDVVVNIPPIVHAGKRLPIQILVTTNAGRAGKHLFMVDLIPHRGEPIPWYHRIVPVEGGIGETFIPLAWNEILGKYSLRVRDILTGKQTIVPIALSSPEN